MSEVDATRPDAWAKATGAALYSGDLDTEGVLHAALVTSPVPSALIKAVELDEARTMPGVVAALGAADLPTGLFGRRVRDMPLLARERVRFAGERVAVVLALSRRQARRAAARVDLVLEPTPAVLTPTQALSADAPVLHQSPWSYPGAVVTPAHHPNLQSEVVEGDPVAVASALKSCRWVIERTYSTPAGHQGYLEPQAWLALPLDDGRIRLTGTTKGPYRLRDQIAACVGLDPSELELGPVLIGGDFGGKGGGTDAALCVALAKATGRPVSLVLTMNEDLISTDARHPAEITVRLGASAEGRLVALEVDALFAGGAYAAAKPIPSANLHGALDVGLAYRLEAVAVRSRIVYTNTVPKGHMRAPGAPQAVFALESALDELASTAGLSSWQIRRASVLRPNDLDHSGRQWDNPKGEEVLARARAHRFTTSAPPGWLVGEGLALYARSAGPGPTSLRLRPFERGQVLLELAMPETGTASHNVARRLLAERAQLDICNVQVKQVSTSQLPFDPGVGASRVTAALAVAIDQLVERWDERGRQGVVEVLTEPSGQATLSFCAQRVLVAVDQATGELKVLELLSVVDVGRVVNPRSHQMQIDGGAVMGLGFATIEDLLEQEGQVWAANLGDFRIPSSADVPTLVTALVEDRDELGPQRVKSIGEMTNVAVAPAVANAIADATGVRIRDLPLRAERLWSEMRKAGKPGPYMPRWLAEVPSDDLAKGTFR